MTPMPNSFEGKEFNVDRESLQEALGPAVDRNLSLDLVLQSLKGREVAIQIRDDRFDQLRVRAIIGESAASPGLSRLWVEDWKGVRLKNPWGIKVLGFLDD